MKKSIFMFIAVVAMVMISCEEKSNMPSPGENALVPDSIPVTIDPEPSPDPEGVVLPEGTINVHEACAIARKLHGSEVSEQAYYIKGWVTGFNRSDSFEKDFPKYGNDFVYITATAPDAPIASKRQFLAYRLLGPYGAKYTDLEAVKVGDFIVIRCYITNYGGTIESSGVCYQVGSTNEHFGEMFADQVSIPGWVEPQAEDEYSASEAEALAHTLPDGATSDDPIKIRGVVAYVSDTVLNTQYGNITFNIADGSTYINCYQTFYKTESGKFKNLNQVAVGDTVLVEGVVQNYHGICEPYRAVMIESSNPNF